MAKFAAMITFAENGQESRLEVRPRHRVYLQSLVDQGKLFASGPWVDDSGALIIYEAANEDEVLELMANDPYAAAGDVIGEVVIKEWNRVMGV